MQQRLVSLTICWLVFGPGTLLFSAGAAAVVDRTVYLPSVTEADDEPSSASAEAGAAAQVDRSTDVPVAPSLLSADTGETPQPRESAQRVSVPCLHGFATQNRMAGDTTQGECADSSDEQQRFRVHFGSRIGTQRGILGDVDGIRVDYHLGGGLTLNGVAGYPVLSAKDKFNATRRVFAISADTARFARAWDVNSYMIEQHNDGRAVSRAVGGAIRYLRPKRSLLFYLDYDAAEKSLNTFMASGAWKVPFNTRISATLDIRNSPVKKHQKKYLQHSMAAAQGWKWMLPSDRIKHFTKDGPREVSTLALGLTHAFSKRFKLNGDMAVLGVSGDETSDSTQWDQSNEYFYHLKLSGKNLVLSGDSNVLDLRHRVTESSQTSSASINTRININRYWKISPRFSTDYRSNTLDKSVRWVNSPALKTEYRWKEQYGFQFELGGKWSNEKLSDADKNQYTYFLGLGYQAKF